jgi:hypothetical protein
MSRSIPTLPEDYELIAFFEVEPVILDPGVPWLYNTLTFLTSRDEFEVRLQISPSYGHLTLHLKLAGRDLLGLDLQHVDAIRLESRNGDDVLFVSCEPRSSFALQLKPHVHIFWDNGPI